MALLGLRRKGRVGPDLIIGTRGTRMKVPTNMGEKDMEYISPATKKRGRLVSLGHSIITFSYLTTFRKVLNPVESPSIPQPWTYSFIYLFNNF